MVAIVRGDAIQDKATQASPKKLRADVRRFPLLKGFRMPYATPAELFDAVVSSKNRGDVEAYLDCYESNATIVLQPGSVASGHDALRGFLSFFTSLKPSFRVTRRK